MNNCVQNAYIHVGGWRYIINKIRNKLLILDTDNTMKIIGRGPTGRQEVP